MNELIESIHTQLPGWNWLVRSNSGDGYFANVTRTEDNMVFVTTPNYAATPEEALQASINDALKIHAHGTGGVRYATAGYVGTGEGVN